MPTRGSAPSPRRDSGGPAPRRRAALAAFAILSALATAALLGALSCTGAVRDEGARAAVIRIVGSDTMQPLVRRWAESYMRLRPDVSIYTEGGGSGRGIEALIAGRADLAAGSRAMQADEIKRLLDRRGYLGQSILTAKDALSIYVNPQNPVRDLTVAQLRDILSGTIRNWSGVGGTDAPIDLVSRPPNSGTFSFLQQHILQGEPYGEIARTEPNTNAVVDAVFADPNAVGYGGVAYGPAVVHCLIEGVEPSHDNVRSGDYALSRYLYLFAAGPLEGPLKDFVNWILSDDGQRVVAEVGYIPLWEPGEAD
jgi:phosphate transport system substrate-binding protein